MESFNRGSFRSLFRKFSLPRPGEDQDSYDENDGFCDTEMTESAAMRAIRPAVLSITEGSDTLSNDDIFLSGFEDQSEHFFRSGEGEGSAPIKMEKDGEPECSQKSNNSRRMVSFSLPDQELHSGLNEERPPDNEGDNMVPNVAGRSETDPSSQTNEEQVESLARSSGDPSDLSDHPAVPDEEQGAEEPSVEEN